MHYVCCCLSLSNFILILHLNSNECISGREKGIHFITVCIASDLKVEIDSDVVHFCKKITGIFCLRITLRV